MPRITRISGSLTVVLIAYWAYALLAVPWIEPRVDLTSKKANAGEPGQPEIDMLTLDRRYLTQLFEPGDWERASPKTKVLKNDRARLLLQDYKSLAGGKVEIKPCTIVFDNDGDAESDEQRCRQSIVLQAPDGAILQFDRPVDLKAPRDANFVGGRLIGNVLIRSDWKLPGPDDDLRIVTSNVRLTKQTISTPDPVTFRWGPHCGNGQDMLIKLLPGRPRPGVGGSSVNIAGIESFELRHLEALHLELPPDKGKKGSNPFFRGGPEVASLPPNPSATSPPPTGTPVDITCTGPFRFVNGARRVATFNDNVRVAKPNPKGDPDTIVCDLLSLWFIDRPTPNATTAADRLAAKKPGSMDLVPERLEATGNPVVVTAPSEGALARAQRIDYNLISKSISLDGDQPVYLQQGPNEISARSIFYQTAADERRLGQLKALGPGWMRGQSRDQNGQKLEAVWQELLQIEPRDQYQVISLLGGAELKSPGVGQLQAKKIFLWLTENPDAPENQRLNAYELDANEDVHISSSELSGSVEQMVISFVQPTSLTAAALQSTQQIDGLVPIGMARRAADGTAVQLPSQQNGTAVQPSSQPMALLPPTSTAPADRPEHFEANGRLLTARMLIGVQKPALLNLSLEDNVRLDQTQTRQPGDPPVRIRGDRLDLDNVAGTASVTGIGKLARFEGGGMTLSGAKIDVNRGTSHLGINGPGQMDIVLDKDLEGRPLPAPGNLTITWQESMDFDGQTARFKQKVEAATPGIPAKNEVTDFRLNTELMEVQLQYPISFSEHKQAPGNQQRQIAEIRCGGGVVMDSHTFDLQRQLTSHDHIEVTDLIVNRLNGELRGGPGEINTVRFGSNDMLGGQALAAVGNAPAPAKPNRLFCTHVSFKRSFKGNNLTSHYVTFDDQVRITYGPVDNWDAVLTTRDPSQLGPDGMVGDCEELSIVQMPLPAQDRRAIELYMSGNAVVEGITYKALANRITYTEAKDLLTLEGTSESPAELLRQLQIGADKDRLRAVTVYYWRKADNFKLVGPQMLEVRLPEAKKR